VAFGDEFQFGIYSPGWTKVVGDLVLQSLHHGVDIFVAQNGAGVDDGNLNGSDFRHGILLNG
jgi:hypothetical protein